MPERYLTVYDRKGRPVDAKTLVDRDGNDIISPLSTMPLVVPLSFNIEDAIQFGNNIAANRSLYSSPFGSIVPTDMIFAGLDLVGAVKRGGTWELQRTYNNVKGGGGDEFVAAFTPAASYIFAVIGRAAGFSAEELLAGGGVYNLLSSFGNSKIDTEGNWWNNPNNVPMIKAVIKSLEAGKFNNFKAVQPLPILQCFLSGTKILLEGNVSKPIEDIVAGDFVMAFNASVKGGLSHLSVRKVKRTFAIPQIALLICGASNARPAICC